MPPRSPAIFWLLLAATFCVDAVAITWAYETTLNRTEELYSALACSQISVLCIGAYFSPQRRMWKWSTPFLVSVAVAGLTGWLYSREPRRLNLGVYPIAMQYLSLLILQVVILLATLWILGQTSVANRWDHQRLTGRWRFAIRHVLALMTTLAFVLVILRQSELVHDIWIALVAWTTNNVALSLAAVVIHVFRWHVLLRFAATAGVAGLLGFLIEFFGFAGEPVAVNLMQGLVFFLWLELGGLIPQRAPTSEPAAAESPARP